MKNLCLAMFLFAFIFASSSCKTGPREIPPMPDFNMIRGRLDDALERAKPPKTPKEVVGQKIGQVKSGLNQCAKNLSSPECDKRKIANFNLMLGDLYFEIEDYSAASEAYQEVIIKRFEAFSSDRQEYEKNRKINESERKKQGDKPNLLAGSNFLKSLFSLKAYKDHAEMVRAERRLGESFKHEGSEESAASALARAEIAFKKAIEYRKTFEICKRELLGLLDQLGKEFQTYEDYIKAWDQQTDVPRI